MPDILKMQELEQLLLDEVRITDRMDIIVSRLMDDDVPPEEWTALTTEFRALEVKYTALERRRDRLKEYGDCTAAEKAKRRIKPPTPKDKIDY